MIQLSEWGAESLGLPIKIMNPSQNDLWLKVFNWQDFNDFIEKIKRTTPENPVVAEKYLLNINGVTKWCKAIAKVMWGDSEAPEFEGAIGKIVDIDEETATLKYLEQKAELDSRTGLLNHNAARQRISKILSDRRGNKYALAMFDLDNFKKANDEYGHLFGDEVLETVASRIKENIRSTDIAARMGGDEFILFMEYKDKDSIEPLIKRIYGGLTGMYKDFHIGISMGIACSEDSRADYDTLFGMADAAMYTVKRNKKNSYAFYDDTMKDCLQNESENRKKGDEK